MRIHVLIRFKVEIHVMDVTDTATFILFCDDAEQLVNISAPELINRIEARVHLITCHAYISTFSADE